MLKAKIRATWLSIIFENPGLNAGSNTVLVLRSGNFATTHDLKADLPLLVHLRNLALGDSLVRRAKILFDKLPRELVDTPGQILWHAPLVEEGTALTLAKILPGRRWLRPCLGSEHRP